MDVAAKERLLRALRLSERDGRNLLAKVERHIARGEVLATNDGKAWSVDSLRDAVQTLRQEKSRQQRRVSSGSSGSDGGQALALIEEVCSPEEDRRRSRSSIPSPGVDEETFGAVTLPIRTSSAAAVASRSGLSSLIRQSRSSFAASLEHVVDIERDDEHVSERFPQKRTAEEPTSLMERLKAKKRHRQSVCDEEGGAEHGTWRTDAEADKTQEARKRSEVEKENEQLKQELAAKDKLLVEKENENLKREIAAKDKLLEAVAVSAKLPEVAPQPAKLFTAPSASPRPLRVNTAASKDREPAAGREHILPSQASRDQKALAQELDDMLKSDLLKANPLAEQEESEAKERKRACDKRRKERLEQEAKAAERKIAEQRKVASEKAEKQKKDALAEQLRKAEQAEREAKERERQRIAEEKAAAEAREKAAAEAKERERAAEELRQKRAAEQAQKEAKAKERAEKKQRQEELRAKLAAEQAEREAKEKERLLAEERERAAAEAREKQRVAEALKKKKAAEKAEREASEKAAAEAKQRAEEELKKKRAAEQAEREAKEKARIAVEKKAAEEAKAKQREAETQKAKQKEAKEEAATAELKALPLKERLLKKKSASKEEAEESARPSQETPLITRWFKKGLDTTSPPFEPTTAPAAAEQEKEGPKRKAKPQASDKVASEKLNLEKTPGRSVAEKAAARKSVAPQASATASDADASERAQAGKAAGKRAALAKARAKVSPGSGRGARGRAKASPASNSRRAEPAKNSPAASAPAREAAPAHCPKCNTPVGTAKFCGECGARVVPNSWTTAKEPLKPASQGAGVKRPAPDAADRAAQPAPTPAAASSIPSLGSLLESSIPAGQLRMGRGGAGRPGSGPTARRWLPGRKPQAPPAQTPRPAAAPPKPAPPPESVAPPPANMNERESAAYAEVVRILQTRKAAFQFPAAWGLAILNVHLPNLASVQQAYRKLMQKLHPDKVGHLPQIEKAIEVAREAKELCEKTLSKQVAPGAPRNIQVTTLCATKGKRKFRLRWAPPLEKETAPVQRYLVNALDPAYGKALTITILEPDYSEELRRYISVEELTSFVLSEEELTKMPKLFQQRVATLELAAANDAGTGPWASVKIPLESGARASLSCRKAGS